MRRCSWMVGESICHNTQARKDKPWIKKQQRLNLRIKTDCPDHGFFTVEMLEHLKNVTAKTTGLLDVRKRSMYETWMHKHPKTTKSIKQIARDLRLAEIAVETLARYRLSRKKT